MTGYSEKTFPLKALMHKEILDFPRHRAYDFVICPKKEFSP